ncbi:MAG: C25 family cysteine peptidase [Bacteroidota bacterium]|nr:C25 family cysteine peptidase [Bacteroidota bacterium]
MKKIILFSLLIIAVQLKSKDGFAPIKADANSVTIEYLFSGLTKKEVIINGQSYQKLGAQNCVPVLTKGFPEVLRSGISLALPNNSDAVIEILSSEFYEIQNIMVTPSKGSLMRNVNPDDVPYTFANIYQQDKFYPETTVELNSMYMLRHQKGASLSVFPIQFNAASKTLKVFSKIVFKVTYVNKNKEKQILNTPLFTSNEEKEILSNRFINLPSLNSNHKTAYTTISEFGSMLVIYHPTFASNIQPLVDWKNQKGIATEMFSTVITGTNYVSVKNFIQSYYTSHPNLLYVLLVGDHEQINAYDAGMAGTETKWSDSMYGFLSGNDFYPEVMVGRFSSGDPSEINVMVNRTLEYEKNPLAGNWYSNGIGIGSDEGAGIGDDGEADWQHMRGIGTKLLATGNYSLFNEFFDGSHGGNDASGNPNPTMVSNAVDSGASIFMYCGHGDQNSCVTSNYDINDIAAGANYGKYPFSIQVACNNGTFIGGTCFSEAFIRATGSGTLGPKGAIASCGSSILMAWAEPMQTQDEIGDIISNQYPTNVKFTLGGLFYNAQMSMLDNYPTTTGQEVMETWIMFGDPSCMLRTVNPSAIAATHSNCIDATATSFSFTSTFANNTYACISQNNQIIGSTLLTNSVTNIALTQTFSTSQNLVLTITEFNKIPYTNTLAICVTATVTGIPNQNNTFQFTNNTIVEKDLIIHYNRSNLEMLTYQLFDLQGRLILQQSEENIKNEKRINLENLNTGLYILSIIDQNNLVLKTSKIIKH